MRFHIIVWDWAYCYKKGLTCSFWGERYQLGAGCCGGLLVHESLWGKKTTILISNKTIYVIQGTNSINVYLGRTGCSPPLGWAGLIICLAQRAHMRGQGLTRAPTLCTVIGLTGLWRQGGCKGGWHKHKKRGGSKNAQRQRRFGKNTN